MAMFAPLSASVTSGSNALGVGGGVESGTLVVAGEATAVLSGSIVASVADVATATTVAAGVRTVGVRGASLFEPAGH